MFLSIIYLLALSALIGLLGRYLWSSFRTDRKGLPPYISTYPSHRALIRQKLSLKPGSSILDLGCGDGRILRLFVKDLHCSRGVGYDINSFATHRGKRMNKLMRMNNIELIEKDIREADVKGFDYIYLYLFPDFVAQLEPRLFDNIDSDTIVICNTFHFVHHVPFEIIRDKKGKERLYLYKK